MNATLAPWHGCLINHKEREKERERERERDKDANKMHVSFS